MQKFLIVYRPDQLIQFNPDISPREMVDSWLDNISFKLLVDVPFVLNTKEAITLQVFVNLG